MWQCSDRGLNTVGRECCNKVSYQQRNGFGGNIRCIEFHKLKSTAISQIPLLSFDEIAPSLASLMDDGRSESYKGPRGVEEKLPTENSNTKNAYGSATNLL